MRQRRARDGWSDERTSPACLRVEHDRCSHGIGAAGIPGRELLCRCDCHASCPATVAGPVTPEQFLAECTCPLADRMREQRVELEARAQKHQAAVKTALEAAEQAQVGSRAELRAQLDAELAGADVSFPPSFRDTWVRTQWALRGPRWARRPRVLWAQVHGLAAGLRSLVRFAWQAPPEDVRPRRPGLTRLPGGVETDGMPQLAVAAASTVALVTAARSRTGRRRRLLLAAATVTALPLVGLLVITGGLGFLMRALRGWQAEKDRSSSAPDRP